jgi:sulfite exporter TauE/SafE
MVNERCEIQGSEFSWKRLGAVAIVVFGLYLLLSRLGFLTFSPTVAGSVSLAAVFVIGLVASFSSCTAIVSGLVVAVTASAAKSNLELTVAQKIRPHVLFNLGRVLGFAVLGGLVGYLGQVITLSSELNGLFVIIVAALMIIMGMNLLDVWPQAWSFIQPPKWLAHWVINLSEKKSWHIPLTVGALSFFLPCGFTQSMQLYALSTADPLRAGLIMAVFALGTAPALLGVGTFASLARGRALKRFSQAAGAFVMVLGIANVQNGATLMGFNWLASDRLDNEAAVMVADGVQIVQMEITDAGTYSPDVITVTENTPVRWEIYGTQNMGCAQTLVVPKLRIQEVLVPGFNEIEFVAPAAGTYQFSCSMGMVRGTLQVVGDSL